MVMPPILAAPPLPRPSFCFFRVTWPIHVFRSRLSAHPPLLLPIRIDARL